MPDMIISANMSNTPATPTGSVSCLSQTCTLSGGDLKVRPYCIDKLNRVVTQPALDYVPFSVEICALLPPSGQCEDRCDSTDCLLVQAEELQQVADRQVARHLLLCLLLTVILVVVSKPPPVNATLTQCQPDFSLVLLLLYFLHHKMSQKKNASVISDCCER